MSHTSGPSPFGHNCGVKTIRSAKPSTGTRPAATEVVHVLVADSGPIQSQLLTRALKSRRDFKVSAVALDTTALHNFMQSNRADVVLIAGNHLPDLSLLRWLRVSYPKIAPVLLAESDDRELVVNAFRAGAKGLFLFTHTPFPMLCKCIHCVFQGQVWINRQQMTYVLDARGVAVELGLSEHTIKKYLLRIFDKVGISSRVELVLYAMSHGEHRPAEWMPSSIA